MGVFDPNADVGGGPAKPGKKKLYFYSVKPDVCKSGREKLSFEFRFDGEKKMFKDVTVNSIFSSVIKGMMLGVGLNPADFGEAGLHEIARAFTGREGVAWCEPNEKGYLEPSYFIAGETGGTMSDGVPTDSYENQAPDSDIPF